MQFADIIRAKRDGGALDHEMLAVMASGLASGAVNDAQAGAFAMAVYLRGLDLEERVSLTRALRDSGAVLTWDLPGPVLDKHSTGGVGDNVSLILAPALAACGAYVPMVSGRGLGHTGGTLDKFDAIPGYRSQPDTDRFRKTVAEAGCAVIGQTDDIAPADRRLYGIRDVSGTVESIDLITASILSKKLAAGLEGLVLDVKTGNGAFMAETSAARELAEALVEVACGAGCPTRALITDMNQPLASAAGNALEMANAVRMLRMDEVDGRLWDILCGLGGELLSAAGMADTPAAGRERIGDAISSGEAAERFGRMVSHLGGPADFLDRFESHLEEAPVMREIEAGTTGFVTAIDTRAIGVAVVEMGGGRKNPTDRIDLRVGFDWLLDAGLLVEPDTVIGRVHAASVEAADQAEAALRGAYHIGRDAPDIPPLIREVIA